MNARDEISQMKKYGKLQYKQAKNYLVTVPVGKSGDWEIKKFDTAFDFAYARHLRDGRAPGIGTFTRLDFKGSVVMSDTCAEINDLKPYLYDLTGRVLVTGLGLGVVLQALTQVKLYSKYIKSITVIEQSFDVIKLAAKHYIEMDKRIVIIQADAYTWKPPVGVKFDSAWHDVWPTITTDNAALMARMRKNYSRFMSKAGQQFCWGEDTMKAMRYG